MGAPTAKLETVVIVSPFKVLGLFFSIIAMLILLITIPTSFWFHMDANTRYGLWIECITSERQLLRNAEQQSAASSGGNSFLMVEKKFECSLYNKVWIQICGGLVVVALICGIVGVFLIGLGFSHKKRQEQKMRYYSATIFVYIVGAVCLLISLIVFPLMFMRESHYRIKENWYLGWSYGVAWGAAIFLLGAALLVMCDRNREEIFYRERLYLNQDDEENVEANQEAKIKTLR